MPIIELKLSGQKIPPLAQQIATEISCLTKDVLKKRPDVTVVTVSFVPDHLWFINSMSLAELKTEVFILTSKYRILPILKLINLIISRLFTNH